MTNAEFDILNESVKSKDIKALKKLFKKYPNDARVGNEYARLLYRTNEYDNTRKAIEILKRYEATSKEHFIISSLEIGKLYYCIGNPEEARNYLEFLEKYKIDKGNSYTLLGRVYVALKDSSKAKEVFFKGLDTCDRTFLLYELALLGIKEEDYITSLKYVKTILKEAPEFLINRNLILNILAKNGVISNELVKGDYSYSALQIDNYSKYRAIRHIKHHHYENDTSDSQFRQNVYGEDLYEEVKNIIGNDTYFKTAPFDVHVLEHPFIGKNGENLLKVVTLPNSKDILTMYPVSLYEIPIKSKDVYTEEQRKSILRLRDNI